MTAAGFVDCLPYALCGNVIPDAYAGTVWRELIAELYDAARCGEAARDVAFGAAERQLGTPLPGQLRDLLSECDGVVGEDGLGLVWGLDRIVADNLRFA